jgi:hypothetical protein
MSPSVGAATKVTTPTKVDGTATKGGICRHIDPSYVPEPWPAGRCVERVPAAIVEPWPLATIALGS